MAGLGFGNRGTIENTNEEIEARLIRRASLRARREARLQASAEPSSSVAPTSKLPPRPVRIAPRPPIQDAPRPSFPEAPRRPTPDSLNSATPESPDILLSSSAAKASINSFSELSRAVKNVPMPVRLRASSESSRTIEMLIAELIRPPLRNWLHENLPPMVERLVQDEVRVQSRDWLDTKLPPIVERLAREFLRNILSQATGQRAA